MLLVEGGLAYLFRVSFDEKNCVFIDYMLRFVLCVFRLQKVE